MRRRSEHAAPESHDWIASDVRDQARGGAVYRGRTDTYGQARIPRLLGGSGELIVGDAPDADEIDRDLPDANHPPPMPVDDDDQ